MGFVVLLVPERKHLMYGIWVMRKRAVGVSRVVEKSVVSYFRVYEGGFLGEKNAMVSTHVLFCLYYVCSLCVVIHSGGEALGGVEGALAG